MKRVRNLGLAAFMAMALLVVPSVASASGGGIVADKYRTVLRAEPGSGFNAQLSGSPSVGCNTGTVRGEIKGPSAKYGLSGAEGWCSYAGGESKIKMNACKFEFEPGTQTFGVGPVGCGGINMSVGACPIELVPQTGLPATQTNAAEGDVSIDVKTASPVKFYVAKKVGGCPEVGYHESLTLSSLDLDVEGYRAINEEGEELEEGPATDIAVFASGSLPVGVFTSGTNYEAQVYPVSYRATPVTSKINLAVGSAGTVQCDEIGASKIEAAASTLKFNEFNGCTFGGQPATVVPNSCSYEFTTQVGVSCTKEGDKIQIVTTVCTITLAAQPFSGSGFTLKNAGEGYDATVGLNSSSTSKSITTGKEKTKESQTGCLLFPTGKIGTFSANVNLSGAYAG